MVNNILSIKDYFSPTFLYNLFQKDPVYVCFLGVAILTAIISLIVGWVKGVKKLRLTGIAWCLAGVAYFLVRKFLASKLPVESLLQGKIHDSTLPFATSLCIAIASVIVVGLLYGLFLLIFRPRKEKRVKKERRLRVNEIGMRYDDDHEYNFGAYNNRNLRVKPEKKKVSFLGRVFGALVCAVNTFTIIATIFIIAVLVLGSARGFVPTYLRSEALTPLAFDYGIDFIIIGILFAFMRKGTRVGFVEALRRLVVRFGGTVSLIAGIYLPFSPFASSIPFVGGLTSRCQDLFKTFGANDKVVYIAGGILAGLVLFALIFLLFWFINFLLKKLDDLLDVIMPIKAIDRALSALVYIVYALVVVTLVLFILYLISRFDGVFNPMRNILNEGDLSSGIINAFDVYLKSYIDLVVGKIQGFFTWFFGLFK